MATIIAIPDNTVVGNPYTEVRANATNLNFPWLREYLDKHVKYGDLLNGMLGTRNQAAVRIRDENGSLNTHQSRVHSGPTDDGIRNATDIGASGIIEVSSSGWNTPVFSRAVNEFSSASAVNLQIQNAINGLAGIDGDVELAILAWEDPLGPTQIKPLVDGWNDPADVVNFSNFLVGQFGTATPPTRSINGIGLDVDRRDHALTNTSFLQSGLFPPPPITITSSVSRQLMTYSLILNDAQASAGALNLEVRFENTGFLVYDDIQFTPYTTSGSGTAVCPLIVIKFVPSVAGVPVEGDGGFQVRLYNVPFELAANRKYYQIGSVIGSQNGINWFPRGS